ncbi:major facilitator superfamily domain-containing protein, partial [Cerioporus squamosus]
MLQLTFFIIVSSSNDYAQHLGGTSTFSGLVIGIPTAVSGVTLLPLMKIDQGVYRRPLHFACASMVLGNVLYGLAYRANWLYLILIGRMVTGFGFTFWMYCKRYCSDPRIVGIRRRTTLAGWQVLGQGVGFSLGPFVGGLLSASAIAFNGYTSPAWIMAALWAVFWVAVAVFFEDVPRTLSPAPIPLRSFPASSSLGAAASLRVTESEAPTPDAPTPTRPPLKMASAQWGVAATMCWFAMTCFFILGAWESNIPVFTGSDAPANPFHFSPFAAGNLIALGGACNIPFLLLNLHFARRVQDRHTLAIGTSVGLSGLLIAIAILRAEKVNYGSLFMAWFLVALGFNVASTVTLSLLSKQLPGEWNGRVSFRVGMLNYVALQVAYVGIGGVMFITLWRQLKAKNRIT